MHGANNENMLLTLAHVLCQKGFMECSPGHLTKESEVFPDLDFTGCSPGHLTKGTVKYFLICISWNFHQDTQQRELQSLSLFGFHGMFTRTLHKGNPKVFPYLDFMEFSPGHSTKGNPKSFLIWISWNVHQDTQQRELESLSLFVFHGMFTWTPDKGN